MSLGPPSVKRKPRTRSLVVLALALVAFVATRRLHPIQGLGNADIAGILYNADMLNRGLLPYRDTVDLKPPGEWNKSRLVIQGQHIEHWLNGVKVLSFELGSAEVKAALAKSKFKNTPGFGKKIKGCILLTNPHNETWFRNMRLRELPAK